MHGLARAGGLLAGAVLILIGIVSIVVGVSGRGEVRDTIEQEKIVGTPDMSPDAIEASFGQEIPDCDVADEEIDTGDEARCFGKYLRIHALESTEGKTYAELPRFVDKQGNPTEDEEAAAIDPDSGQPMDNPVRETWISATAFSTALNTSFFAEQVANFGIVVGIALVLIGIGFLMLILFGTLRPAKQDGV